MVARDVIHFCTLGGHTDDLFQNLEVGGRKVALAELPYINDVPVEDEFFRLDTTQVSNQLVCLTAISTQMDIRNYS